MIGEWAWQGNKGIYPSLNSSFRKGFEVCCRDVNLRRTWQNWGIVPSITESYEPYANAIIAERVHGILTQEFLIEKYHLSLNSMEAIITDVIKIYDTKILPSVRLALPSED